MPTARPLQALPRAHLAQTRQITFIPRDNHDGQHGAGFGARVALHLQQRVEVLELRERAGLRDVVDEQEGVGAQVRRGPQAAVFFLAGGVGDGEGVGLAVDGARDGVGVFDCGVVSGVRMLGGVGGFDGRVGCTHGSIRSARGAG